MSEDFKCEQCGKEGRRRRMTLCPEGWYYGETQDSETGEVSVLAVCSEECREAFFRPGPGKLTDDKRKEPR